MQFTIKIHCIENRVEILHENSEYKILTVLVSSSSAD